MRIIRRAGAAAAAALVSIGVTSAPVWAAAPVNDEVGGAIPIAVGDQVTADTTEATTNDGDAELNSACGLPATKASVWYTFTPTADTGFVVDTTASSYSTGFMVFEGTPSAESMVGCGVGRSAGMAAHVGKTYTIAVVDYDGDGDPANGGNLVLDLEDAGPLPTLDVEVDPRATVDKSGVAWLTGTYTCSLANGIWFDIQLRENVGRFTVDGDAAVTDDNPCDGSTIPFKVAIGGYNGKYAGGKASARVSTDACRDVVCDNTYAEHTIQLIKGR